jgi:hypothetical protein
MMAGIIRYFIFLNGRGEVFGYFKGNVNANRMKMDVQEIFIYSPDTLEDPITKFGFRERRKFPWTHLVPAESRHCPMKGNEPLPEKRGHPWQ